MRVLHISSAISWRGGEQQIAYLYEELAKLGVEQWIFCPQNAELATYCQQSQIPHFTYRKRFSVNPLPGYQIARLAKKYQIDIVHLHDSHAHTFGSFAATFFGLKVPLVLSRRVDFPVQDNPFSRWKYNLPAIKAIICVSDFIRQLLKNTIKADHKLKVVHDGIDLNRFTYANTHRLRQEYAIPEDHLLIANVAALAPHKDYFTFVDTAAVLLRQRKDLHFFIIGGDGGEQAAIENYITQKGLQEQITLTGFRRDIPQIFPEFDLFLFTSKTEGLGTSLLDAMACKTPIVATAAGGIPEIVLAEKTGLLAPVGDAQKLAQAVLQLLEQPELRAQIIAGSQKHLANFTKAAMGRKTLEVYKSLTEASTSIK